MASKHRVVNYTSRQRELAKRILEEKWYRGSNHVLSEYCSFCEDAHLRDPNPKNTATFCEGCVCPKEICYLGTNNALLKSSMVGKILRQYDPKTLVKDVRHQDLSQVIGAFQGIVDSEPNAQIQQMHKIIMRPCPRCKKTVSFDPLTMKCPNCGAYWELR